MSIFGEIEERYEQRISRLTQALEVAERNLETFGAGGVIESINRGDYSIMQERIVDWFGVSDFRVAAAALAEIKRLRNAK